MTDNTQALMDQAYSRWQSSRWSREEFWAQLTPKERVAVFVGNLNYQVGNGGFSQWCFNGYSDCSDELLQILPKLGEAGQEVAALVVDVLEEEEVLKDEEEGDCSEDYDGQFYALSDALLAECEAFISLPDEEFLAKMRSFRYLATL